MSRGVSPALTGRQLTRVFLRWLRRDLLTVLGAFAYPPIWSMRRRECSPCPWDRLLTVHICAGMLTLASRATPPQSTSTSVRRSATRIRWPGATSVFTSASSLTYSCSITVTLSSAPRPTLPCPHTTPFRRRSRRTGTRLAHTAFCHPWQIGRHAASQVSPFAYIKYVVHLEQC